PHARSPISPADEPRVVRDSAADAAPDFQLDEPGIAGRKKVAIVRVGRSIAPASHTPVGANGTGVVAVDGEIDEASRDEAGAVVEVVAPTGDRSIDGQGAGDTVRGSHLREAPRRDGGERIVEDQVIDAPALHAAVGGP